MASWTVPLILSGAPDIITRHTDFSFAWPVFAFAALAGGLVTLGFGLAPAFRLSRVPAMEALNSVNSSLADATIGSRPDSSPCRRRLGSSSSSPRR